MCESTFVAESTFVYHLKGNMLAQYSVESGDILSCSRLPGRALLCGGVLYIVEGRVAEGRCLAGGQAVRLADVPEDTEYIHTHGKSTFFVSRAGADISVHRAGDVVFSARDVLAYQFEDGGLYVLGTARLERLDLATQAVSVAAEVRNITSFSVRDGSVALGLKSGKVHVRNTHFHWHNTGVKALRLSAACNEVYSVSSKRVVHRYSLGTQRYRVLFDFAGTFQSMRVFGDVLVLESRALLTVYSLKYDRVLQTIYLFTHVDKLVVLDQRGVCGSASAEVLEAAEDLVKEDLAGSAFAFANDGLVVYCSAADGRPLRALCPGTEVRDFFSDRSFLYVATRACFLIYHMRHSEFCLIKRIELKAGVLDSVDAAVFACGEVLVLSGKRVYRVSEFTGFLTQVYVDVRDLFVFAGAVCRVDSRGVAQGELHVHLEPGIERVRVVGDTLYLGTRKSITVVDSAWRVVRRAAVEGMADFVVTEDGVFALREEDAGKAVVSMDRHSMTPAEEDTGACAPE
ncbi:UNVERIFIED_CONTAM: hypothetical protein PYX00_011023 [Menopon gallinae]|uniref:Uncharacterized protein n=1 Tax=Menopon gallinae TaxID=328185 RepID=A0AAW2H6M6_9NEOP